MSFKLMAAQLMNWALEKWPEEIELLPFWVRDTARENRKHPAYIEIAVPDGWVKNVKGDKKFIDTYVIMRVPAELFARWTREQRGSALDEAVNAAQEIGDAVSHPSQESSDPSQGSPPDPIAQ